MKAPGWDANFALSSAHGVDAQAAMLRAVLPYVRDRRTAVDAGAHIGLWSAQLAPLFGTVYAFEPVEENFVCLKQNVRDENVYRLYMALGDAAGQVEMSLPPGGNSGCWYALPSPGVPVVTLDSLRLEDVDLIKIDVEGNEGKVLLGASRTIAASSPVVMFEDNGVGQKYFGERWVDPKSVLRRYDYRPVKRVRKDEIWVRA